MSRDEMWGTSDARLGCQERRAVQLRELRGAGSKGSSVAADPADCGQGAGGAVAGIRKAVRQTRPTLDPAGETASRFVVAGVLFGALGAAVDGTARLQSAVPLVCRLSLDEAVWDETVFTKNRERLIEGDIARRFMAAVLNQEPVKALLSDDHFSVDGTLIEAWASMKSFRPKDGGGEPPAPGRNGERDFHGEKRSNETHASTTDPDARLYRKGPGQPAKLAYLGHVLMENRHALVIDTGLTLATGTAERAAALEMVAARPGNHRITLGADKAYDVAGFVADLRQHNVTPHVAQNTTNRRSAIDGRTTRHPGYAVSGRAAHRSGLDTLASSGSCHRTKAAASRRELELLLLPVGSLATSVTCPLRSTGITPLPRYYGAVRPYPPHRYFRPHSFAACTFSLGIAG